MKILKQQSEWRDFRQSQAQSSVGFVPTMGALHAGHMSLVAQARQSNDVVVVSIYINPTQFDQAADLNNYPQLLEQDLAQLQAAGVDAVLLPTYDWIYPDQYTYQLSEHDLSGRFCGAHRPGHFDGVLTVVMKLLNMVGPKRAYFGEKDYQQLHLIKGMAEAFFLPSEIIGCATMREQDGLAMSSRNLRLTAEQRSTAPLLYQVLSDKSSIAEKIQTLESAGFQVEYIEQLDDRLLAAVQLGEIRLIDNVSIGNSSAKQEKVA
ncbi:pantoate--beta-alanine ligase [Marinicella sp. W31]|uniref:pantoate--beta-alanine ligase n=1 Tax=Marinicella sp. W31 TaxID=3023713 RepID=UPI0037577872